MPHPSPSETTPAATAPRARWPLVMVAFFALCLLLPLCTFQVRTTEKAIKTTFGKYDRETIGAGLHWKLPWPIQKVHRFDQRLRIFESKYSENFTADDRNLVIVFFLAWRIEEPTVFLESVGSTAEAERVLSDVLSTEKNVVIAQHPISHLVSTDPEELRFQEIENEIHQAVRGQAKEKYGIHVEMLGIRHLGLPETITQAVFQRMIAERENLANRIRQEGEREAATIQAEANRTRDRILAEARARAKTIRGEADSAAATFYDVFREDPEFAVFLRKLEALEATMQNKTTIVIDRDIPPFDLLKADALGDAKPSERDE